MCTRSWIKDDLMIVKIIAFYLKFYSFDL
ncbi:hypothetical protein LINGRAHAP2_LOCUS20105 [Linum grandiflorum]